MFRRGSLDPPAWPVRKIRALLVAAAVAALAVVAGAVLAVVYTIHPAGRVVAGPAPAGSGRSSAPALARPSPARGRESGTGVTAAAVDPRDLLAARSMRQADPDAAHPGPVSPTAIPAVITLPAAVRTGPAGVPTGFSQTPAGALAQLAVIDQVAVESASLEEARSVIAGWAMPGGPTPASWSVTVAVAKLLAAAGRSSGPGPLAVVLTPVMGLIKGTVGNDFVVPCVDFELDVTLAETARGAVADCQRMVWNPGPGPAGGRWLIGPGPEAAIPPAVWPDTATAVALGYADLRQQGGTR